MVKTAGSEFSKWRGKVIFNWGFFSHFSGCISPVWGKKKKGTSEKLKSFTSPLWSTLLGKSNMQIWSVSRKNSDSLCSQGNTTPKLTTPYHTVWPGLLFLLVFLHWTLIWAWGSPGLKGNLFRREQKMTSSPSYSVHHSQKPTLYNYLQYSEHTTAIFVYYKSSGYLW